MKRAFSVAALVLGISLVSVVFATAQEKSVKPGINKPFENPDLCCRAWRRLRPVPRA
jgi:hypothetical protein